MTYRPPQVVSRYQPRRQDGSGDVDARHDVSQPIDATQANVELLRGYEIILIKTFRRGSEGNRRTRICYRTEPRPGHASDEIQDALTSGQRSRMQRV